MLDDEQRVAGDERGCSGHGLAERRRSVRRVQENQVETVRKLSHRARKSRADNSIAVRHAQRPQVGLDQADRPPVLLDERHVRRPPAERFDADRSSPGVAVEDARSLDAGRQDVEKRLP
jgi:hypothetical protein